MKEYRFSTKDTIVARLIYSVVILMVTGYLGFVLTRPMSEVSTALYVISFAVFFITVFSFGKLFIQINKKYVVLDGTMLRFYNGKKLTAEFDVLATNFNITSDKALQVLDVNNKGYLFESTVTGGKSQEIFDDINALKNKQ